MLIISQSSILSQDVLIYEENNISSEKIANILVDIDFFNHWKGSTIDITIIINNLSDQIIAVFISFLQLYFIFDSNLLFS